MLLLSRSLGGASSSADFPREAFRRVLADGLYNDLACDKLDRRTTESYYEQTVGLKDGRNKGMPKVQDADDTEQEWMLH